MLVQLPLLQVNGSPFRLPPVEVANESALRALLISLLPTMDECSYYLAYSPDHRSVQVRLRIRGGKGGFGSQLRAQGNKMSSKKRAGNYEACRDLSGQRLRSQKHAKLIAEYLEREPERLSAKEKEIREKMQRHLEAPNRKTMFNDPTYLKTTRKIVDGTEEAVRSLFVGSESDEGTDSEYYSDDDDDNSSSNNNNNSNKEQKFIKERQESDEEREENSACSSSVNESSAEDDEKAPL